MDEASQDFSSECLFRRADVRIPSLLFVTTLALCVCLWSGGFAFFFWFAFCSGFTRHCSQREFRYIPANWTLMPNEVRQSGGTMFTLAEWKNVMRWISNLQSRWDARCLLDIPQFHWIHNETLPPSKPRTRNNLCVMPERLGVLPSPRNLIAKGFFSRPIKSTSNIASWRDNSALRKSSNLRWRAVPNTHIHNPISLRIDSFRLLLSFPTQPPLHALHAAHHNP